MCNRLCVKSRACLKSEIYYYLLEWFGKPQRDTEKKSNGFYDNMHKTKWKLFR